MATIPLVLRGVDISLVRVTQQIVNATTGVLTDNTQIATITARLNGVEVRDRIQSEEVSAITSSAENQVAVLQGTEYVLREIIDRTVSALDTAGPKLAKLRDTLITVPYAKLVITRGGNTWTGYGLYAGYTENLSGRTNLIAEMSFLPIDSGSANVAYT